jgi:predicted alpha/beta-fold hydrolase
VKYTRERLELNDGDCMDLDVVFSNWDTLVVMLHGLEVSSNANYIASVSKHLSSQKVDAVVVNFRGCSGEENRLFESYHSGKTDDLDAVIKHINKKHDYKKIIVLGYSLGGNLVLKYMGEQGDKLDKNITGAIAISVPCDLTGSSIVLGKSTNRIYLIRFMITLRKKTLQKLKKFPDSILSKKRIRAAKDFKDFDNLYTAPAHGFKDADDYYKKNSSKQFLSNISKPTLLVNALDDTFLSEECFPFEIAKDNKHLFLETPKYGGHVGFNTKFIGTNGLWLEKRIYDFINEYSIQ